IPRVPALELGPEAQQRHRERAAAAADDVDDVDATAAVDAVDVKPDIAQLRSAEAGGGAPGPPGDSGGPAAVDGRAGTLAVLRSGAVRLRLGGVLFDVSCGADCQFLRGLLAVDQRAGSGNGGSTAHMLGNVDAQLVCTPDLCGVV
ncbi:hypothetical protein IWQ56_004901, partial [Coemansia nantahalensis]